MLYIQVVRVGRWGAFGQSACGPGHISQTVYNTKGTRAHTHRELIRKWLWEPMGSSLEYI